MTGVATRHHALQWRRRHHGARALQRWRRAPCSLLPRSRCHSHLLQRPLHPRPPVPRRLLLDWYRRPQQRNVGRRLGRGLPRMTACPLQYGAASRLPRHPLASCGGRHRSRQRVGTARTTRPRSRGFVCKMALEWRIASTCTSTCPLKSTTTRGRWLLPSWRTLCALLGACT